MEKLIKVGKGQFKALSFGAKNIVVATIIISGCILIFRPSMAICAWVLLPGWLLSAIMLFSPKQIFKIHVFGEALEGITGIGGGLLKSIASITKKAGEASGGKSDKKKSTGIFSNEATSGFLSLVMNVFLVQTVLFLSLPLYVNYTEGGLTVGIFILMVGFVLAKTIWKIFKPVLQLGVVSMALLYVVGISLVMFPQIGYYSTKFLGDTHPVDRRVAKVENEILSVSQENKTAKKLAAREAVLEDLKATKMSLEEYKKKLVEDVRKGK